VGTFDGTRLPLLKSFPLRVSNPRPWREWNAPMFEYIDGRESL
jgi:hypothetical protein